MRVNINVIFSYNCNVYIVVVLFENLFQGRQTNVHIFRKHFFQDGYMNLPD
jgi:hypothetical protein